MSFGLVLVLLFNNMACQGHHEEVAVSDQTRLTVVKSKLCTMCLTFPELVRRCNLYFNTYSLFPV